MIAVSPRIIQWRERQRVSWMNGRLVCEGGKEHLEFILVYCCLFSHVIFHCLQRREGYPSQGCSTYLVCPMRLVCDCRKLMKVVDTGQTVNLYRWGLHNTSRSERSRKRKSLPLSKRSISCDSYCLEERPMSCQASACFDLPSRAQDLPDLVYSEAEDDSVITGDEYVAQFGCKKRQPLLIISRLPPSLGVKKVRNASHYDHCSDSSSSLSCEYGNAPNSRFNFVSRARVITRPRRSTLLQDHSDMYHSDCLVDEDNFSAEAAREQDEFLDDCEREILGEIEEAQGKE